uniref:DNA-3-methyladenine glycosylase n=1 Tax=Pseudomonas sp. PS02288 TaxID=2991443 RepID=UPI00249C25E9
NITLNTPRGGHRRTSRVAGAANAVLIKSAHPWLDAVSGPASLQRMLRNSPAANGGPRAAERLCAGQTLLCRALGLKVSEWSARRFDVQRFFVDDVGERPAQIIQTTRLGIPPGRDEHLAYRFVDAAHARHCTRNPLRRGQLEGRDYHLLQTQEFDR